MKDHLVEERKELNILGFIIWRRIVRDKNEVREIVYNYIKENFLFGYEDDEITDDMSFFEIGVLDSTGIMELVSFLEKKFGISVLDGEILQENLDSISLITDFIMHKE